MCCCYRLLIIQIEGGLRSKELDSGMVKIGGHAQDFTQCGETEQPETARSSSGRQSPQALQHRHGTGLHRLDPHLGFPLRSDHIPFDLTLWTLNLSSKRTANDGDW